MSEELLKQAAALSDKARVDILKEIAKRGTVTCAEAGLITNLAQPTVSHHIKILIDANLICAKKVGRCSELSINKKSFTTFSKEIGNLIS